jgi:hypothetical protein
MMGLYSRLEYNHQSVSTKINCGNVSVELDCKYQVQLGRIPIKKMPCDDMPIQTRCLGLSHDFDGITVIRSGLRLVPEQNLHVQVIHSTPYVATFDIPLHTSAVARVQPQIRKLQANQIKRKSMNGHTPTQKLPEP